MLSMGRSISKRSPGKKEEGVKGRKDGRRERKMTEVRIEYDSGQKKMSQKLLWVSFSKFRGQMTRLQSGGRTNNFMQNFLDPNTFFFFVNSVLCRKKISENKYHAFQQDTNFASIY